LTLGLASTFLRRWRGFWLGVVFKRVLIRDGGQLVIGRQFGVHHFHRMDRVDRIRSIGLEWSIELRLVQPMKFDLGRSEVDQQAHFEASCFKIVDHLRFVLWS